MKKVFRTHIALVLEGRLLSLWVLAVLSCLYWVVFAFGEEWIYDNKIWFIFSQLAIIVFTLLCIFLFNYFWQLFWGVLIITDKYIKWKCVFCKPIKIPIEKIKYVDVRAFVDGNVYKDRNYYGTDFLYILISSEPLPQKRIDKIRSKNNLIKFPLFNNKLICLLSETLPSPYNTMLSYIHRQKTKMQRKKRTKKDRKDR